MNLFASSIENRLPNERKENWFRYYHPIRREFGAEALVVATDGPDVAPNFRMPIRLLHSGEIDGPGAAPIQLDPFALNILDFPDRVAPRIPGRIYPAYWRSVWGLLRLARALGAERLIAVETDAWVYTRRLARRLAEWSDVVGCPYCERWTMPELMLCVYPATTFDPLIAFIESKTWDQWAQPQKETFENEVPKRVPVRVWHDMIGDRYREWSNPPKPLPPDADFSVQDDLSVPIWRG